MTMILFVATRVYKVSFLYKFFIFHIFFQWTGDDNMRQILDGKLVLLNLLCQRKSDKSNSDRDIERPCISFRVAGSPGEKKLSIIFKVKIYRQSSNSFELLLLGQISKPLNACNNMHFGSTKMLNLS